MDARDSEMNNSDVDSTQERVRPPASSVRAMMY